MTTTTATRFPRRTPLSLAWWTAAWLLVPAFAVPPARAQEEPMITPNYKDADLGQIVEAVSEITKKNFIIDPRVRAQVTMVSNSPLSADAFYEAFLAILQVHGFVAAPAGRVIKIIPDANARQVPANDLPERVSSSSDEIVTQVIAVQYVSAAQLVPILRPLIPQYGHLAAYPASNMLIISDRAANVNRMVRIIRRIDQSGDEEIDVIPLQHASAAEVVRVVNVLYPAAQAAEGGVGVKLVADERTNSVLVSGESSKRLQLKTLVTHLDTPLEAGGDTVVRYLRYADAEKLAAKLKEQATVTAATTGAAPGQPGAAAAQQLERNITIWAEPETNALVVTAPPKVMRALMTVVDKLDIRRQQVHVEAILAEVTVDKAADLGINWAVDGTGSDNSFPVGGFIQPIAGSSIVDLARGIDDPSTLTSVPTGLSAGVGRIKDTGTNFAVLLRALRNDANTNIISTPSVVTMDNQEAEIKIAQEVPFITGSFTQTGTDATNPFQTIQREEVGTILKITPQISEGETVILKIEQEASSIAASSAGAVDLITNKRTITTNVLIEDGGIIVLGGLIRDELLDNEQRVPILGSIPLIGHLFKVRHSQKIKTNFMVFIRPRILRDEIHTAVETNSKYDYLRREQLKLHGGKAPLLPFEKGPALPPIEPPTLKEAEPAPETAPPRGTDSPEAAPERDPAPPPDSTAPQSDDPQRSPRAPPTTSPVPPSGDAALPPG